MGLDRSGSYRELNESFAALKKKTPVESNNDVVFYYAGSEQSCLTCFISLRIGSDIGSSVAQHTAPSARTEWLWTYPYTPREVSARFPNIEQFAVIQAGASYNSDLLTYTFVLTDGKGVRKYGHCSAFVNGEAVVAISPYPWCNFFYRLAYLYRTNDPVNARRIVESLCRCGTPPSGAAFLTPIDLGVAFSRPYDRLCSFIDTSPLDMLSIFPDIDTLFSILADLLLEKHIIIVGPNFALVANVVMSLQALIAPFDWMHILIPILPSSLVDVLAAPPPYLVGILTSQLPLVEQVVLDGVVMVHLGANGKCQGVVYHDEVADHLPHSGTLSALRIGLNVLKLRDPRDKTVRDLCSLFLSYYATLFGEVGLKKSKGYIKNKTLSNRTIAFYKKLLSTQSLYMLSEEVNRILDADNIYWMDNEFIVAIIRAHPDVYPTHYAQLISEEKQGGGYLEKYEDCFGSRENFTSVTAAVHGFGGHKFSLMRLIGNCVCGRWCCLSSAAYDDENDNAFAFTTAHSISNRSYFSAPSEMPVIVAEEQESPRPLGTMT